MAKYFLTIVLLLLLVSFLETPTDLEALQMAQKHEAAFIPSIGEQIQKARMKRHISPEALAMATGLSVNNVQKIETGDVVPTKDLLFQLQEVLKCEFAMDGY